MTTQTPQQAAHGDGESGQFAISPAVGPVPPIYVSRSRMRNPDGRLLLPRQGRTAMDYHVEVVTLPVSDVDRAAAFYTERAGFALDVDYHPTRSFRVVQLTPPGSACSIQIGLGLTDAPPGSTRATHLAVADLETARDDLAERGVPVSGIRHKSPIEDWQGDWRPGIDPQRRDYASIADFADPDGNTWIIQEIGHRSAASPLRPQ
jgi:catechol 2,3-dioxygenase-like lactoylglutathione lyase family enzyme